MSRKGPIVILEDDVEDFELMVLALRELNYANEVRHFTNGRDALYYLMDTKENPLLVISDINMPSMDGLELRHKINETHLLHRKSIPFIFLTTSTHPEHVVRAYDMMVQGYFVKPDSFEELKRILSLAVEYWINCRHPNNAVQFQFDEQQVRRQ